MEMKSSLSKKITINADLKRLLIDETIKLANFVFKSLKIEDPGLVVQVINLGDLHIASGLNGSPIPPGNDAGESYGKFLD
jgi:hypothetical protein